MFDITTFDTYDRRDDYHQACYYKYQGPKHYIVNMGRSLDQCLTSKAYRSPTAEIIRAPTCGAWLDPYNTYVDRCEQITHHIRSAVIGNTQIYFQCNSDFYFNGRTIQCQQEKLYVIQLEGYQDMNEKTKIIENLGVRDISVVGNDLEPIPQTTTHSRLIGENNNLQLAIPAPPVTTLQQKDDNNIWDKLKALVKDADNFWKIIALITGWSILGIFIQSPWIRSVLYAIPIIGWIVLKIYGEYEEQQNRTTTHLPTPATAPASNNTYPRFY